MKLQLEGFNSRMKESKSQISELEDKAIQLCPDIQMGQQNKEKVKRSRDTLRDMRDNIKWNNVHIYRDTIRRRDHERAKKTI